MKIFAVWDKGRDAAPDMVRRCLDRWQALNPGHELVVLDHAGMMAALPRLAVDPATIEIQALTDILRVHLMATEGGVWTDATLLPVLPLDAWLPACLEASDAFAFQRPGPGRRIGSWFLAARPGGSALWRRIAAETAAYWDRPRSRERRRINRYQLGREIRRAPMVLPWKARWLMDGLYPVRPEGRKKPLYPYFWFHYLVGWLEETDPETARLIGEMAFRPATLPLFLQQSRKAMAEDFARAVPTLLKCAPVHKLDWRRPWPDAVFAPPPEAEVAR